MIARQWRGWTSHANAAEYQSIVHHEVIPDIEARRIPGFLSIDLLRRDLGDSVEFTTIMWFDSLEAVKTFMGDDYDLAHVPSRAQAVLSAWDDRSAHYEVIDRRDQGRSLRG